ncbi:MAG: aspartate kinase [Ignisphaera sp.]
MEDVVVKIGGSLLRNGKSYIEVAQNIKKIFVEKDLRPIVVVSAMKGITDKLLQAARGSREAINEIELRYTEAAREIGSIKLVKRIDEELKNLRRIVESIESIDLALLDIILSYGEKISKMILVQALELNDIKAFELNAKDVIITNNNHGDALIDYIATSIALEKVYTVIRDSAYVPVIEGFIGATPEGVITTLGRGGSDYTATTIASLLRLNDVYLVTDVEGIMTTDPDLVPTAKLVKYMSYSEALEASMHGAKGINPKSFDPLEKVYGSNVLIGSWKMFGTTISKEIAEEFKGPKLVMKKDIAEYSYIAIIGEGTSKTAFIKDILNYVVDLGIEIKGIQSYIRRPSIILYVDRENSYNALKKLHKVLFER